MESTTNNLHTEITGPFYKYDIYNEYGDVVSSKWLIEAPNLDNSITELDYTSVEQGDADDMAQKINRSVVVNGQKHWIRANTEQEYADKLYKLFVPEPTKEKHQFGAYAMNWFEAYSRPNVDTTTAITYKRQLTRYLIPAFGEMHIEDITTDDIQKLYNSMNTTKATKDKLTTVLRQILQSAEEDGYIAKSPLKSKKLRVTGKASQRTAAYSLEQMQYLIHHIGDIKKPQDRTYLALQALHPLRLEEVLGLKWSDIDFENLELRIRRAVTHPDRNQPEIKDTKTDSSNRPLGLAPLAANFLIHGDTNDFILGGKKPLTYTQVQKMCKRIQSDIGFSEKITPIRFRTTVLTDLYDVTKDIKLTQAAAGHTSSAMTLKHYIKGREAVAATGLTVEELYTS